MRERWKLIHNGGYEVSSLGRVRRVKPGPGMTRVGRILKQHALNFGHLTVTFWTDGRRLPHLVHRLVAAAFIGPCPEGKETHHKDGNPANNRADNLEYITHAENIRHGYENKRGENHHCAKLTDKEVAEIRARRLAGERGVDLAKEFNVSQQSVCCISKGRSRCQ